MVTPSSRRLLITDLDNTLWDWFAAWHASFSAMLDCLVQLSGVPQGELESSIRKIHQLRGTAEYSNLIREVPELVKAASPRDPADAFDEALHVLNSKRKSSTKLYPEVRETLLRLKSMNVKIVAYTESISFWTEWRVKRTGLDGIIDVLYSAPDHDLPSGVTFEDLRRFPDSEYGLAKTRHEHVERGVIKPNVGVLRGILDAQGCLASDAVYIGDSLMKDIVMAQEAGVLDVHAAYGLVQGLPGYDLLRRVSHWTNEDVERERALVRSADIVVPTMVCHRSFAEVVAAFQG